ncbi:hypothetical protein GT020_01835 [Glutamicibacter soli]|uniref:Uncharacterized protein n=1 Tax=Glutamicibacter soli TaxID=453836 RepID=A0A6L9FZ47_9MICC|nr:hypothetical protein [Glutamicibacter soli]NAZ14811.1 hypothetical protein [Glutamicibacter soli]
MFDFEIWEPWLPFIVILISLIVIPFVTTVLTRWQESRRSAADSRQDAMSGLIAAAANNDLASAQRKESERRSIATGTFDSYAIEELYNIDVVGPAAELKAAIARVISLSQEPDAEFTQYLSETGRRQFRGDPDWSLNLAIVLGKWVRDGKTKTATEFITKTNRSKAEKQPTKHQQEAKRQEPQEPEAQ